MRSPRNLLKSICTDYDDDEEEESGAQCQMIAPISSLQDWHALSLDKEPWFDSSTGSSLAAAHGADS